MKISILTTTICLFCQALFLSQNIDLNSSRNDFYKTYSIFHKDTGLYNNLHPRTKKGLDRWEWFWSSRVDASGKYDRYNIEMKNYIKKNEKFWSATAKKSAQIFSWDLLGPNSRPLNSTFSSGQGRFNCLWVDPDNLNHIIAGSNNGGLWETWNAENSNPALISWSNLTDPYCVGGVTDIAVHPTDKDIIYFTSKVGTGGIIKALVGTYSLGLFKSTDGGSTWNLSFPASNIQSYKRIEFHPTNPSILYLLGSKGLAVSYDSGATWTTVIEDVPED